MHTCKPYYNVPGIGVISCFMNSNIISPYIILSHRIVEFHTCSQNQVHDYEVVYMRIILTEASSKVEQCILFPCFRT